MRQPKTRKVMMMNYEEMSDFEINKAVHFRMIDDGVVKESYRLNEADFVDVFRNEFGENAGPSVIAVMRYVKDGIYDGYNPFGGAFDYCNNASDAWPIIVGMIADGCIVQMLKAGVIVTLQGGGHIQFMDKNPLRAAMIAFLIMQESK